jgi:Tfp pilus assembly protein PilW
MQASKHGSKGFTLLELMVAMATTLVVLGGVVALFTKGMDAVNRVTTRADIQANVRAGLNELSRDLYRAGTGIPFGGIPIPSAGTGGTNPRYACDFVQCYLPGNNSLTQGTLYPVGPGNNVGPTTTETTDAITVAYVDPTLDWSAYPTTNITSTNPITVTMPAGTTPALNDPAYGLQVGDVMMLSNSNGQAIGVVTGFSAAAGTITFAAADPLNMNQPLAPAGNIPAIAIAGSNPKTYPLTTVSRIIMATYFLQATVGADNRADSRLMRQIGAHTPQPLADHIQDLKLTYDLWSDVAGALTVASPTCIPTGGVTPAPNMIRKVNIKLTGRSIRADKFGVYDNISFSTSVGPRNLSFHDRYN